MCGICGDISFTGREPALGVVNRMASELAPRGPDGVGLVARNGVAFAQRRLKILDLSEHAEQPMVDSTLGLTVVFNGELYNFRELRAELESLGYRFFSDGDTEVLLKAYHAWGPEFVERVNGMFAFVIHERDTGRVVLGRDRLGIKPLYFADASDGGLRFASTLPALIAAGGIDTDIDPVAFHHYLTFHAVVPAPRTILRGVRKLPPATLLVIEPDGTRRTRTYWSPQYGPGPGDADRPLDEWCDLVLDTLRRAVRRRLVSDVEVGVLLSGGLDSSLIVGLLAEQGGTGTLQTFSVGFEDVGGVAGDEFRYSDVVASRFCTRHHKIFVDTGRMLPALGDCIRAMAEPMVSHDVIGFYLLADEVARHVTVVQSGQGADEVFGGYHWYPPLLDSAAPVDDYARVFFDRTHARFAREAHPRMVDGDHSRAFVEAHFAQPGAASSIDRALRLDTTVMLVDDPVKRVDNMTMAHSLEARVPFLDHEVVELAARIPAELKVHNGGKHVLKEAARRVIPGEVIDRPKGYFPVPALTYLRGPYLALVRDALTSRRARERELFAPAYVDRLLREPEAHHTPLKGSELWQVGLLELWLQAQGL